MTRFFRTTALCAMAALIPAPTLAQDGYQGLPRTFLWNPDFNALVETADYATDGPFTIGFSNASQSDAWLGTFYHSVQYGVSQNLDRIERFIVTDANGDPTKQISDIQDLLEQDIDLLLVNPATADALDPILSRAMRRGVPVVTVARRVDSDDSFVSFVTASDTALARMSATWMAEHLGGKGRIVLLPGLAGASPAEMRLNAAREVFAQFPGIKIVDTQYTSWSPANGRQIMGAILQREGAETIDGVWSDSGLQGSGSVEAFMGAGITGTDIPAHTGGDLNGMYQLAAEQGFAFAGVDYTPSIGAAAVNLALDVLEGTPVPQRLDVNFQVVLSEGDETLSIKPDVSLNDYVAMDQAGSLIMGSGIPGYDPANFAVDLPN